MPHKYWTLSNSKSFEYGHYNVSMTVQNEKIYLTLPKKDGFVEYFKRWDELEKDIKTNSIYSTEKNDKIKKITLDKYIQKIGCGDVNKDKFIKIILNKLKKDPDSGFGQTPTRRILY